MPESPRSDKASPRTTLKTVVFYGVALSIPFIFLLAIEGTVRLLVETPLVEDPFLNIGAVPSFFRTQVIDGQEYRIVNQAEAYGHSEHRFTTRKAPGSIRVFAVGGSAAAGWPQPRTESYSAYLEQALRRAYPDRVIEVVNLSAHAYASYRIRFLFDMIRDFDPDAFIIYTGNNEFLEPRTYVEGHDHLMRVSNAFNRLATVRLGLHLYARMKHPQSTIGGAKREHRQYERWSKVARVTLTLRDDPKQFAKVGEHYAFNVTYMVQEADRLGIPAILITVPVNMRDWQPNVARSELDGTELLEWKALFANGQAAVLRGELDSGIALLAEATAKDPSQADAHFHLARAYEQAGLYEKALVHYQRAIDEDRNPFRALSSFNEALREISSSFDNAFLADAERNMVRATAPFAPGFNMMLDYVHPTRAGNLVIAKSVFDAIVASGLMGDQASVPAFFFDPVPDENGITYDVDRDYFAQSILLGLFGLMHQYEALVAKANQYADAPDPRVKNAARVKEVFEPYLEMRKHLLLGESMTPDEIDMIRRRVHEYYGEIYEVPDLPTDIF